MVATILLNACLVATSSVSLYFTIRWHYGPIPALLAAVSLAVNPWYFSSVAWDYPDGPAIAYGFLAAAFALRPHGSRALNTALMASCLALSGFTNMSAAPMVLSVLIFPLWRWRRSLQELVREGIVHRHRCGRHHPGSRPGQQTGTGLLDVLHATDQHGAL